MFPAPEDIEREMDALETWSRADYLAAIRRYQHQGDNGAFAAFIAEWVMESEKEIMRLLHIPFPRE